MGYELTDINLFFVMENNVKYNQKHLKTNISSFKILGNVKYNYTKGNILVDNELFNRFSNVRMIFDNIKKLIM